MKYFNKVILVVLAITGIFELNYTCAQIKYTKLVWSDEFNQSGLPDSAKWGYDAGRGCPQNCGWGNNELQYYTVSRKENARVENGHLIIEAHRENFQSSNYTSARLVTKEKGHWKYGRIEVRAKLPSGNGMWPAIWMLPAHSKYGNWPHSGEIDIVEYVGYIPDSLYATVHTGAYNGMINTQKGGRTYRNDLHSEFHVYSSIWTEDSISFFIDGEKYFSFRNDQKGSAVWPFDQAFYLILNIAVGGNWGGKKGVDNLIFPQRMEVDYVRVYQ
ncbi:MAG: family 16 glycosylhydrolase [Bacteroidota bacterium]|jgi:beta-glucanase (GH16 family)